MVLGALAFLAGLIPGIFLQQVLTAAVYGVLEASYKIRPEFNLKTLFLTAAVYGGAYVLALLRNNRRLKNEISGKYWSRKEKMKGRSRNRTWPKWLFLAALGCLIFFSVQMYRGGIHYNTVLLWILGLIVSAYVLFFGLSAFWYPTSGKDRKACGAGKPLCVSAVGREDTHHGIYYEYPDDFVYSGPGRLLLCFYAQPLPGDPGRGKMAV